MLLEESAVCAIEPTPYAGTAAEVAGSSPCRGTENRGLFDDNGPSPVGTGRTSRAGADHSYSGRS
ncbi:hypothetical protein EGT50_02420 [Rhodococcus xishaensis]|uniref:Uncharacterized protein n=1 Tax=Rhodococcus xishaensis TaxID=2487364 RepID=A0A3S3BNK2_9NOCA|nr:hypothetical protein EGT50_02420 [Rhodococcus xishaensis]